MLWLILRPEPRPAAWLLTAAAGAALVTAVDRALGAVRRFGASGLEGKGSGRFAAVCAADAYAWLAAAGTILGIGTARAAFEGWLSGPRPAQFPQTTNSVAPRTRIRRFRVGARPTPPP